MRAASFATAVAILALAGCGGSSTAPQYHLHLTAFERHGKTLFISKCGGCHELTDAGTTGNAGPAITSPWAAFRVRETIADGPGMMPDNLVAGQNADAVAAYVAAATR